MLKVFEFLVEGKARANTLREAGEVDNPPVPVDYMDHDGPQEVTTNG